MFDEDFGAIKKQAMNNTLANGESSMGRSKNHWKLRYAMLRHTAMRKAPNKRGPGNHSASRRSQVSPVCLLPSLALTRKPSAIAGRSSFNPSTLYRRLLAQP